MKVKNKLITWSCGTIMLIVLLFLVVWLNIDKLLKSNNNILHTHKVLQHTFLLQKYIERLEVNIRNCTILKDQKFFKIYENDKNSMFEEIDKLKSIIWTPTQKKIIQDTSVKITKWTYEADKFISKIKETPDNNSINIQEINSMLLGDKYLEQIRNNLEDFLNNEEQIMIERKEYETSTVNSTFALIALTTLFIILLFIVFSYLLAQRIINPINNTSKIMKEIAEGNADLTKRIPQKSNDEIGQLILWFNKFIENLQSIVAGIKEEAGSLNTSSNNLSSTATTLANEAVANSSAIDHINSAVDDLVQISETNSSSISNSLSDIKERLIEFISFFDSSNSDEDLIHLKECIESVTETISEIAGNTLLVENFITTIKEISTQSRILAVNASIQANKAGEFGKGFSVIASEIKNLSVSSDKSIKDVMDIFKRINSLSHRSALNIDKIEHILKELSDKVSEQNSTIEKRVSLLTEISTSINELSRFRTDQLKGIDILSSSIESIKDSSSNNAEGARKMEKASVNMLAVNNKIKEKIDNFKV